MHQTIVSAISNRKTLEFRYNNEARIVDPHCYGVDGKGHDAIRAFQRGGKGRRLFHVKDISGLVLGQQSFEVQMDYKRNDKAMGLIYAQV